MLDLYNMNLHANAEQSCMVSAVKYPPVTK